MNFSTYLNADTQVKALYPVLSLPHHSLPHESFALVLLPHRLLCLARIIKDLPCFYFFSTSLFLSFRSNLRVFACVLNPTFSVDAMDCDFRVLFTRSSAGVVHSEALDSYAYFCYTRMWLLLPPQVFTFSPACE